VRAFRGAFGLQARVIFSELDYLMPLVTVPMFTIVFLAIVRHAGRGDLAQAALLAPVLIALWQLSLFASGEILAEERWAGTLEPTLAAPASFPVVVLGRIVAVTAIALVSVPEVLVAGRLFFGVSLHVHHPLALVLTMLATAFAVSGTALIMAAVFVLTRSARTFQNSLSYPLYLLGGVFVPISFLPAWLRPLSAAVFLSWSGDLLRASLSAPPVHGLGFRIGMVCVLGLAGLAIGGIVLERVLRGLKSSGMVGVA
jgi:ABC-2 type transport system permease protein